MSRPVFPIAVDIGATRLRVAIAQDTRNGPQIRAVAVRDLTAGSASSGEVAESGYVAALVEEALAELGVRERRCVCAIGEPDALLRAVRFPRMTAIERDRAARFEAQRYIEFSAAEATIRVHPIDEKQGLYALGIARTAIVASRVAALREAGLRPIAMDHEACALARAVRDFDAIVDIGYDRTSLHVLGGALPVTLHGFNGGAEVTRAITRELSIDEQTAEKRKRILGTVGAGEEARTALAASVASLIELARSRRGVITRIALVGNGARVAGLAGEIEAASGALVELPVADVLRGDAYPDDVVRASAPDWNLVAGLALWGAHAA